MTHARQQIREAFVTALTGQTDAGDKVFNARVYPMEATSLPGIVVYTPEEAAALDSLSYPRAQIRTLSVVVEAYAKSIGEADKAVDELAVQIEQKISADPALGGLVKDVMLTQTQIGISGDGDAPVAVGILTFTVTYRVRENAPQTPIQ